MAVPSPRKVVKTSEDGFNPREGIVYCWQGYAGDLGLSSFPVLASKKVKRVAVGGSHFLFLTTDGQVLSCGQDNHGQLGLGCGQSDEVLEPQVIEELSDKDIVDISCGKNHSATVSANGQVYCWGQASDGQCAVSDTSRVNLPSHVVIIDESLCCEHGVPLAESHVVITSVSCGAEHTVALSNTNDVWVWGSGIQLGLEEVTHTDLPKKIDLFGNKTVLSVCCGDYHTLALVEKSDKDGTRKKSLQVATDIQTQKYFPPLCKKCNKEIYTYTDTNDTCIIESEHHCKDSSEDPIQSNASSMVTTDIGSSLSSCPDIQSPDSNPRESKSQENVSHELSNSDPFEASEDTVTQGMSETSSTNQISPKAETGDFTDDTDSVVLADAKMSRNEVVKTSVQEVSYRDRADSENREDYKVAQISTVSLSPVKQGAEITDHEEGKQIQVPEDNPESKTEHLTSNQVATSEGEQDSNQTDDSEVVWRRAISLEEEERQETKASLEDVRRVHRSKSFLDEKEAREYLAKQFEDDEGVKDSATAERIRATINNFIPYPSTMMESMKSMTSKALTNIAENLPFMSGQNVVELDGPPPASGGDPTVEVSVQERAMATSNSSLELATSGYEEMQESSFIEIVNQDVSILSSAESTPIRHRTPVDEEEDVQANRKSKSVKTLWAKEEQLDKRLSQESFKDSEGSILGESIPKVSLDTEVWAWGHNSKGQLGVGDTVDREKPCCIKMFSSRCVLKLAAGAYHSLALTSVAQVYSWGQNSNGQLGHNEGSPTPNRIKFMRGYYVWDIAAGDAHSLFLTDSSGMKPDVFYSGKQPTKDIYATVTKTLVPRAIGPLKSTGWLTSLSAKGDYCACLLTDPSIALPALYELGAIQRGCYYHLNRIKMDLLKPLSSHAFYTSLDVFPYKSSLQNLLAAFYVLTKNVGEQIAELTVLIREGFKVTDACQFRQYTEPVDITRKYSRFIADFIAIGGFEYCAKIGGAFFDKIENKFVDLVLEKKVDKSLWASNFRKVMMFPLHRLKDFCRHLAKLAESLQEDFAQKMLKKAVLNWESLKMTSLNEISIADQTRTFWEGCNQKIADCLRIPGRHLLRDSKHHPLSILSAGRFSSHLLLLFDDIFVHAQGSVTQVLPLETLWVETPQNDSDSSQQVGIILTAPEETLDLIAGSPAEKAEWLMALNSAISKALFIQKSASSRRGSVERLTPPLIRHSKYTFTKAGIFKDAKYSGSWLNGKPHGYGELKWSDNKLYVGMFKQGLQHGNGVLTVPKGISSCETQEGEWKDGKLNGYGTIKYANGDCYEGYFKDGQKFGHGTFRQGRHMTSTACIYIGEWLSDKRHGYGVQDDILKGEKYMGLWQDDVRHGKGIVVTLDGMYFEGTFAQNKLSGFGLMLTEDNSCYEGQFACITQLQGNGTLTLPTGDKLEGHFSGSWNEDLKFSGTFIKAVGPPQMDRKSLHLLGIKSEMYGKLSVPADQKWGDIFRHCCSILGYQGNGKPSSAKAWENVAVLLTWGRKQLKEMVKSTPSKVRQQSISLESMETIPVHSTGNLTMENYHQICDYLHKAFDTIFHPLGKLMENLVDVFRAAYIGIGAHPRLLHHAIEEVKSYVQRIYSVVRILFPDLPVNGGPILVFRQSASSSIDGLPKTTHEAQKLFQSPTKEMEEESISEIVTAAGLLYPLLLPKIYPPLFDLYALYNDKDDEKYWERVIKLNRQGDMALMAYLGIEQKFWLMDEQLFCDKGQKLSQIRDVTYASAVDNLQQLSTAFSPIDKLRVLEKTFLEITSTVQNSLREDHTWCMDDLFPIFQFVVVRAKIRHLGAEIHMIDDLIEHHLEYGELGLMSTTLKACYFQIQNEKMPHH